MKKITIISAIFAFAFIVLACENEQDSGIKKEVLQGNNITEIAEKIEKDNTLSKEELIAFQQGLTRLSANKDSLVGKTVGEIIENQELFVRTTSKNSLKKSATLLEINLAHTFALQKLSPASQDGKDFNVAIFDIKNIAGKDIKSIDGLIQLYNAQNQLVKIYTVQIADGIKQNETKRYTRPYPHDPKNQYDLIVRQGNLRPVWTARTIEYVDGEKLTILNPAAQQAAVVPGK